MPSKKKDLGLGGVEHEMNPTNTLLHTEVSPFGLSHEMIPWDQLSKISREGHMSILILIVFITFTISDSFDRHSNFNFILTNLLKKVNQAYMLDYFINPSQILIFIVSYLNCFIGFFCSNCVISSCNKPMCKNFVTGGNKMQQIIWLSICKTQNF